MKIALSVSGDYVSGPGEGDEVWIVEVDKDSYKVVERFENPAKYATQVRGIFMLRSALDHGANVVILSEIGPPGYRWAVDRGIKVFIFEGKVEDAIRAFIEGRLGEAQGPTHNEHHHGHHHYGHWHREVDNYDFLRPYIIKDAVIADLGCGTGYYCHFFKNYASRLYCVDIDNEALEVVRNELGNYDNVVTLNEDVTKTSIPSGTVDIAFMSNAFHDVEDKEALVREIGRILKIGGRLLIIEFRKNVVFGPPFKLSPEEVEEYFVREGFIKENIVDVSPYHYMIILRKQK